MRDRTCPDRNVHAKLPLERAGLDLKNYDGLCGARKPEFHVVAVDFGIKRNILRCSPRRLPGDRRPAYATAQEILGRNPDGVLPIERPRRSRRWASTRFQSSARSSMPACRFSASVSAISCWGSRLADSTIKMPHGHHGANHPVMDYTTGKVEITSMNHGFAVERESLPEQSRRRTSRCSMAAIAASVSKESRCSRSGASRGVSRSAGQSLPHQVREFDAGEAASRSYRRARVGVVVEGPTLPTECLAGFTAFRCRKKVDGGQIVMLLMHRLPHLFA